MKIKSKKLIPAVAVSAALVLVPSFSANAANQTPSPRTITVNGQGIVYFSDDLGRISATISATNLDPNVAQNTLVGIINKVNAALKAVSKPKITNGGFNLSPQYNQTNDGAVLIGYQAQYSFDVKDSFKNIGKLISTAINAGGSALTISGITFESSHKAALTVKARKAAIADAKSRALDYLTASGDKLGKVVSISEVTNTPILANAKYGALATPLVSSDTAPLPIFQSNDNIEVDVQVVFQIN